MTHQEIFGLIAAERHRQDELRTMGKFIYTCADQNPGLSQPERMTVLAEEVGEVARAVCNITGMTGDGEIVKAEIALRTELVQVAAVCLAWLETL